MLKLTETQARKVHRLVRRRCANCYDGRYCLLLDDEVCAQLLCRSGICCKFFRDTVLPTEQALCEEIRKNGGAG